MSDMRMDSCYEYDMYAEPIAPGFDNVSHQLHVSYPQLNMNFKNESMNLSSSGLNGMIGMLKNGDPKYSKRSSYGIKKQISKLGS